MGRAPCCEKMGVKKGPWTPEEDRLLVAHIEKNGHDNWRALPKLAGLSRCGKSCRLRWINYLRPDIKRGNFTQEEEDAIIKLHEMLGNRWSAIAARLPGRTDNEIKNVWHTHLKKRLGDTLGAKRQPRRSSPKSKPSKDAVAPESTSTLTSSEVSSVSDDVSYAGVKCEDREYIQIPVIDESFWLDDLDSFPFVDENLFSDSSFYDFREPMDSLMETEDNTEFWYDLLIRTGGVPEM